MNDNSKLYPEYEFSRSEEPFECNDTHFCNDVLFPIDDFSSIKKPINEFPIGDIQQKNSLVIHDSKNTLQNQFQLYVGNMTKWTTDQEIADCITSIGVSDLIDVTFFENHESGQSKGFCIITLQSEHSRKQVLTKLPNEKLYGKSPLVTYISNEAYSFFDSDSKIRKSKAPNQVIQESISGDPLLLMKQQSTPVSPKNKQPGDSMNPCKQGLPNSNNQNLLNRSNHHKNPIQGLYRQFQTKPLPKHGLLRFGVGNHSSSLAYKRDTPMQGHQQPKYTKWFFNKPSSVPCKYNKTELSLQKMDEIMNRNRIVSSSAIARAITNTANGEFSDAIETLITAMSLIKESKVANCEGSNILVRSLQDVLHEIEIKSHYSRKENKKLHRKLQRRRSCDYDYKNI